MATQSENISVANAAKLLKVTVVTVRGYIKSGRLPAERIGRTFVLKRADVSALERRGPGRPKQAKSKR